MSGGTIYYCILVAEDGKYISAFRLVEKSINEYRLEGLETRIEYRKLRYASQLIKIIQKKLGKNVIINSKVK